MITSAVAGEGKSTTVANLGVAFAQAGRNVLLVDLDFRRSSLARFFGLDPHRGLADVITGSARVGYVVSEINLTHAAAHDHPANPSEPPPSPPDGQPETVHRASDEFVVAGGRRRHHNQSPPSKGTGGGPSQSFSQALHEPADRTRGAKGSLRILPFGTPPPHTLDASLLDGIGHVLDELKTNDELVLIDSPPLLRVGDALALTSHVDGLLILGSLRTLRAPQLKELRRVIDDSPADKLGFILTGAELEGGYEYLAYPAATAG
jgi:Mrp family chromosome partitioning ATPase